MVSLKAAAAAADRTIRVCPLSADARKSRETPSACERRPEREALALEIGR